MIGIAGTVDIRMDVRGATLLLEEDMIVATRSICCRAYAEHVCEVSTSCSQCHGNEVRMLMGNSGVRNPMAVPVNLALFPIRVGLLEPGVILCCGRQVPSMQQA